MRVLHVIRTLNPSWGGPVEGVRNIAEQAMRRGHEVHIVTLDSPDSTWLSSWRPGVHALGRGLTISGRYGYAPQLSRWLENHLPTFDRVVIHSIWMYFSYAAWKVARRCGVPYYLFIHGALDPWFRRQYPLKHLKKTIYWKLVEHKVLRDAQAVLFTTHQEMIQARDAFSPYQCQPVVVGYGIAPVPERRSLDRECFLQSLTVSDAARRRRGYILLLGRIHEKKGIDLLLRAFAASKNCFDGTAVVVAGPGDANYLARLKALAFSLGIAADVIWTGPLYGEAKLDALREADAYILPSHQENFGISVVEALACSTPVLISNKVNIWREVQDDEAGFVEPDDEQGTIRLLQCWAALSSDQKRLMRERAKDCFSRHFNIVVTCDRLFDVVFADANGTRDWRSTEVRA